MIEQLLVLFLGVYGALATPHVLHVNEDLHLDNDTEVVDGQFLGTENLNEKTLPISRLYSGMRNLPAYANLAERAQVPRQLPGTRNLAEKRIPDIALKRLSQLSDVK